MTDQEQSKPRRLDKLAELKRLEEQLEREVESRRQSEERYRLLVEKTNDLIWEVDASGAYSYVSPRSKELLGYEPEELIGKTPFEFMPPEEAERLRAMFNECVASGEGALRLEVVRLHKDGRRLVHETNVSPIFDAAGAFWGFRGISRDVTERKRTEERLLNEHRVLHQLLRAQDRERPSAD